MKSLLEHLTFLILICLTLFGCTAKSNMTQLFVDGQERIQLHHQIHDVKGKEEIVRQGYNHPVQMTVEDLTALLNEISINKFELIGWGEAHALFYQEEISKLAPRLVDAFTQASSDQWIYFSITAEKPALFNDTLRITDGICFIKDNKLNFVFSNLNIEIAGQNTIGAPKSKNDFKKGDPRTLTPSQTYRFVFQPEKPYQKPPVIEGDQWLSDEQTQWLVFILDAADVSPVVAESTPAAEPDEKSSIKERLKKLKELRQHDLITDKEYEAKRKQILKEL